MPSQIVNPFQFLTDRIGDALDDGYVYIGVSGQDPELFPQACFFDEALTVPATQPLRTIAGYIVNPGAGNSAADIFTATGTYSVRLKNKQSAQVFYKPICRDAIGALFSSLGAGYIGFSHANTDPAGTVGNHLKRFIVVTDEPFNAVWDNVADDTAAIQAAIDFYPGAVDILLPAGTAKITSTIFLRRDGVRLIGCGTAVTNIRYTNVAGGIAFSGDTAKTASLNEYADCALLDFTVVRSDNNIAVSALNDPDTVVDLTSFSYSHFNIGAQTTRANACIYYGQGNAGTAPYFNHIETTSGWFGGTDRTQTGIRFRGGAWAGGSSGPNANMIGHVTRAASLSIVGDIAVGQGNMISNIGGESIKDAYFKLGGNAAVQTGTSTGSNGAISLKDTTKTWVVNAYIGGGVKITAGTGAGQVRRIANNTATQLTLSSAWATIPDATSVYAVYENRCENTKIVNVRQEGSGTSVFIDARPDSTGTEILNTSVQSAGSYLTDESCSPGNKFYGASRTLLHYTFVNPGPSANINAYPRTSVFGGVKLAGQYVVDWVAVEHSASTHGGVSTTTVDCGGAAVGGGTPTIVVTSPAAESTGMAFPVGSRVQQDGLNKSLFLNLQTDASFSPVVSVNVTIAVTTLS